MNVNLKSVRFRFMVPVQPVCLEKDVTYTLRFEFRRYQDANSVLNGGATEFLLVDSVRFFSFLFISISIHIK